MHSEVSGACDSSYAPDPQPSSPFVGSAVAVLHWPEERETVGTLVELGRPCLLLVGTETTAPVFKACLVDWARTPVAEADVQARVAALSERARRHVCAPTLDDTGQLSFRDSHVFLSRRDEQIARVLVESFGRGVARERLLQPDWRDDDSKTERVRLCVARLRRRVAPLGLSITNMRGFGYYMHATDSGH